MIRKIMATVCFVLAVMMLFGLSAGQAQAAVTQEYNWKLVSEEVDGDFMTDWAHEFAKQMKEWSDGKINIEVYPYGDTWWRKRHQRTGPTREVSS